MEKIIDNETASDLMISELSTICPQLYRNSTHVAIRCTNCGDSKKSRHCHLYIKISPDERDGILRFSYHCKLCGYSGGMMSLKVAKDIGIQNEQLLNYIAAIDKTTKGMVKVGYANGFAEKLDINDEFLEKNEHNEARKLDVLYNRLHCADICTDPGKYKIILNLFEFFRTNKLQPNPDYGRNVKNMLRYLDQNCIGFISFDNTHINFRDINPNPPQRYTQYNIYPRYMLKKKGVGEETSGIYVVPHANVNLMHSPLRVVMAEGPFDILRVYCDFFKMTKDPGIIFAGVANANGYLPMVNKLMSYGAMFDKVRIYSDADVELRQYIHKVKPTVPDARFEVIYNTKAKDVGDIRDPLHLVMKVI